MNGAVPDVTVITAVYNTRPYLARCIGSVLSQTIGPERIELIAVDDGSTDGGGAELDRFAAAHPETIRVVHQANSGGPAAPSNVALGLARGRYVFFIGSDDHLGPEALERMVACAEEHGSDVVLGKMIGVGGRRAPKAAFEQPGVDVPFPLSKLVWALSNTKLFRRDLVERHRLRFPEDVSVYSDVPFTIEAMAHAGKISTLVDYDYYYTVERADAGNVTYSSRLSERLAATRRIVDTVTRLYGPGPERDALLYRTFAYEQWILLQAGLLALDERERRQILDGVADLADAHLTDAMRRRLPVEKRVRFAYAQRRDLEGLRAAIEFDGPVRFAAAGRRAFARYPGFRAGLGEDAFELVGDTVLGRLAGGIEALGLAWAEDAAGPCLELRLRIPVSGIDGINGVAGAVRAGAVRVKPGRQPRKRTAALASDDVGPQVEAAVEVTADGETSLVRVRLPLRELAASRPARWSPRLYVTLADRCYDMPLTVPERARLRGNLRGVTVGRGAGGRMVVEVASTGLKPAVKRGLAHVGISIGRK